MSELLLKEKLVSISTLPATVRHKLNGVLRFVDKSGHTFGLFLDKDAMAEMLEQREYASPEFWQEIETSRKSGTISAEEVRKSVGL